MSRLRDHDGYSLPEVLIVLTLSTVLLGATLLTFANFNRNEQHATELNEQVERARNGLDILSRHLRNLARPGATISGFGTTPSLVRAAGYDVIFQTSSPERTWVRYCLSTSGTHGGRPISPDRSVLFEATSTTSTLTAGMAASCPGTGWTATRTVTDVAVNRTAGLDRPVFSYSCPGMAVCGTDLLKVKGIRSDLYLDLDVRDRPLAERVSTAIHLRNQNEPPVAEGTWRPGSVRSVLLNASGSTDPEGRTLQYYWFVGAPPAGWGCGQTPPLTSNYLIGITATLNGTSGTSQLVTLVVCDPGALGSQQAITVVYP